MCVYLLLLLVWRSLSISWSHRRVWLWFLSRLTCTNMLSCLHLLPQVPPPPLHLAVLPCTPSALPLSLSLLPLAIALSSDPSFVIRFAVTRSFICASSICNSVHSCCRFNCFSPPPFTHARAVSPPGRNAS